MNTAKKRDANKIHILNTTPTSETAMLPMTAYVNIVLLALSSYCIRSPFLVYSSHYSSAFDKIKAGTPTDLSNINPKPAFVIVLTGVVVAS